jgi:thymidylate synthase (FAD)
MSTDASRHLDPKWSAMVLDHGFVVLRNIAGPTRRVWHVAGGDLTHPDFDADDTDPANAARMSFDATDSGRTREQDLKLSAYLMRNLHTSPFEQVQVWLEMKLPIFVARQFVRHRTVRLNEVSGRYVVLPAEWYIPDVVGAKPTDKKQGQAAGLDPAVQRQFKQALEHHNQQGYDQYLHALDRGVPPDLAVPDPLDKVAEPDPMGVNLGEATIDKFNEVSHRVDAHVFIHYVAPGCMADGHELCYIREIP